MPRFEIVARGYYKLLRQCPECSALWFAEQTGRYGGEYETWVLWPYSVRDWTKLHELDFRGRRTDYPEHRGGLLARWHGACSRALSRAGPTEDPWRRYGPMPDLASLLREMAD